MRHQAVTTPRKNERAGLIRRVGLRRRAGSLISEAPLEQEVIVSVCFAVEARHKIVGVAIRCPGGFRVFSSDRSYRKLEQGIFPNARAVARSVARLGARA